MRQELEPILCARDCRMTTTEPLYHMSNHPYVLQLDVWQKLDHAPDFPKLHRFLAFWPREIDGPLYSVRVASTALICSAELRYANSVFTPH